MALVPGDKMAPPSSPPASSLVATPPHRPRGTPSPHGSQPTPHLPVWPQVKPLTSATMVALRFSPPGAPLYQDVTSHPWIPLRSGLMDLPWIPWAMLLGRALSRRLSCARQGLSSPVSRRMRHTTHRYGMMREACAGLRSGPGSNTVVR